MPRHPISKDTLDYERRGRLLRDDLAREAVRRRTAVLLAPSDGTGATAATSSRPSATVSTGGNAGTARGRSREVVLKVVNWTKGQRSPVSQALYAAHARVSDPPERGLAMATEDGREIRGRDAIRAEIAAWGLKSDRANLSAAARRASIAERAGMALNRRLAKRQAAHLILSIPSSASSDPRKLEAAVQGTLDETLGRAGFRYLYTIHTDHSDRPHAHVIVKATSEPFTVGDGRQKTRQLRLNPRELEAMRQVFARHAQERGLNVVATRREDRAQLRAEILVGRAPLRENMKLHQAMKQSRQGRAFERSTPDWYKDEGFAYERRRLARAVAAKTTEQSPATPAPSPAQEPNPPPRFLTRFFGQRAERSSVQSSSADMQPVAATSFRVGYFGNFRNFRAGSARTADPSQSSISVSPAERRVAEHFRRVTRDPEAALASFKDMARELHTRGRGIGLAVWAANNHPIAFGDPTGAAGPGVNRKDTAAVIGAATPKRHRRNSEALSSIEASLRAERASAREAARREQTARDAKKSRPRIARSLAQLAALLARETSNDPNVAEHARYIRSTARAAAAGDALTPDNARKIAAAAPQDTGPERRVTPAQPAISTAGTRSEKARLYQELQQRIRRSDAARSRIRQHGRSDDGGPQR